VPTGARGGELIIAVRAWLAAAVMAMSLALPFAAWATEQPPREVTREQATRMLQQRYGPSTRVVRADLVEQAGRHVYVFRLLSANGRVWIVHIDAQSGTELP